MGRERNCYQFHHAKHDIHYSGRFFGLGDDKELGYSKYDYYNKETDNFRSEHSQKTMAI